MLLIFITTVSQFNWNTTNGHSPFQLNWTYSLVYELQIPLITLMLKQKLEIWTTENRVQKPKSNTGERERALDRQKKGQKEKWSPGRVPVYFNFRLNWRLFPFSLYTSRRPFITSLLFLLIQSVFSFPPRVYHSRPSGSVSQSRSLPQWSALGNARFCTTWAWRWLFIAHRLFGGVFFHPFFSDNERAF